MEELTRQHDWTSTPLGAREAWPPSLRTTVDLMLASGLAMCAIWGPERILLYNDAYANFLGERHPSALGRPTAVVWPELWDEIEPLINRTFAGESCVFQDQPLVMTRNGYPEETWWDFAYSPVRTDTGVIVGLLNVTSDTTGRVIAMRQRDAALERLRASERRLSALIAASSDILYTMSPDWREMKHLDGRGFIADMNAPTIQWMDVYLFPEDRADVRRRIDQGVARADPFVLEHRVRRADGGEGWTLSRAIPILDAEGNIVEWFGMAADVTARHSAETALRESEAFMSSVLAASTDCIKVLELDGRLSFFSEGGMRTMEISDFNQVKGCPWPDLLKNEGPGLARDAIEAARQGRTSHFFTEADTYLGTAKFWSVTVSPIHGPDGQVARILSVSRDCTELERSREQQRLLNNELAHRIKNTMSVVQAIAHQTLRTVTEKGAVQAFSDRLGALAASHNLLMEQSWSSARMADVARVALATFGEDRFSLDGPEVDIGPRAALALSLMLHELATNAVKYGALSTQSGEVTLVWVLGNQGDEKTLRMTWVERGGPPAREPTRKGFGSRIIRMGLTGSGGVELRFENEGLTVEASAPLYQMQEA